MLLADLVATSQSVAATPKRSEKIAALAALLQSLTPDEIEPAVGFLTGEPRQGRIGVGWATLSRRSTRRRRRPASTRSATSTAVIDRIAATTGRGIGGGRASDCSATCSAGPRSEKAAFVVRLLTGELRQGALAGLMADAIATAAEVPAARGAAGRDAQRRPRRHRPRSRSPTGEAGARRHRPRGAARRCSRCSPRRAADRSPRRWPRPGRRRWSGSSTARASRCTAPATRCASSPATSTTSPTGCPRSSTSCAAFPADDVRARRRGDRPRRRRHAPAAFQDTMSRFGRDDAARRHALTLRPFFFDVLHVDGDDLLDRAARRARATCSTELVGEWRVPGDRHRRRRRGRGVPRRRARRRPRRRDGEGARLARTRPAGGARAWRKVKPVRTLDLVVLAAEWGHGRRRGLAVEPPPRRPRPRRRRVRDGRQDVQGPHRRAAHVADRRSLAGDRDATRRPHRVRAARARRRDRARRRAGVDALPGRRRAALRPRARATAPTRTAADADTIDTVRALL